MLCVLNVHNTIARDRQKTDLAGSTRVGHMMLTSRGHLKASSAGTQQPHPIYIRMPNRLALLSAKTTPLLLVAGDDMG